MNTTSIANSAKRLFTPVVLAAAVSVPAFADYRDDVANTPLQAITQPLERGHILPPLSDHIIVATADENDVAVNDQGSAASSDEMALSDDQAAVFDAATALKDGETVLNDDENDGTSNQEPEQVVVVIVPEPLEAVEQQSVSDDGTAHQYDRGYYKDSETVAVAIVLNDEEAQNDGTAHQYDRGYYKDPETTAVVIVLNDEEAQGD
jgi:hypothetical protein